MNQQDEQELEAFAQSLRRTLRASENVDAATARRLAQARRRAVLALTPSVPSGWRWLALAGMAAAALTLSLRHMTPSLPATGDLHAGDTLDLLTDDKDPQFYRELEFYKWLEQHQRRA